MSNKISVIFISFLIFWLVFAPKSSIMPDSGWISNSISLFLLWYVRHDLKHMFTGRNKTFNLLLLTYFTISVYSVYYNADTINKFDSTYLSIDEDLPQQLTGVTSIKYLLFYSIGFFASSLYIQRISNTKHIRTLLKTLFFLFLIVLIYTYIEMIITPPEKNSTIIYSVGNKFSIGYNHLYLCTLYYLIHPFLNRKKQKLCLLLFISLMLITSITTWCSTMTLATIILMFLSLITSDKVRNYLASANVVIISLLVFNIGFFLLASWLVEYDFIQYVITELLNENITLTGRLQIYLDIQKAFTESPWIGLGYGNSMVVSYFFTGAFDAQNGLVELFIQTGIIGVATFLFLVYTASKTIEKNDIPKYPLVVFIYTIIIISTVEIPFKPTFIFFLSFCFIQGKGYQKSIK